MELHEIAKELKTQDNRFTSDPIFLVQEKVRIYGMDMNYSGDGQWMHNDGEPVDEEIAAELDPWGDYDNYELVGYLDQWQFVQPFFTEKSAQQYIDSNSYRHGELRIYVQSGYRNPEFQAMRKFAMQIQE